jgi:hypothetical protein
MHIETLTKFLNEANKATYADKNAEKAVSSRAGSKEYHFEKGGFAYHDTYFGSRDFIGEEIVYENGDPVWGMNYFGVVLDEEVSEKEVFDFLREALMQEYEDVIPVRGPSNFSSGDKEYRFSVEGDFANFSGKEEILFGEKVVYRCLVHGGVIEESSK